MKETNMMDLTITVQGMTCGHCEKAVKNAVNDLAGVSNVSVNLDEKLVSVKFNESETNVDQIKEAIEDQGYTVDA